MDMVGDTQVPLERLPDGDGEAAPLLLGDKSVK